MNTATSDEDYFDVAIVGYGPTGVTLAHLLGLSGIRTLVLERESAAYHLPRAIQFDDEVMRVFQTLGLAGPIDATTRVNTNVHFVDPDGNLLLDWPRPAGIGRHGWHGSYRFHQPELETILRDGLARYPHVTVRTRSEVFLVEDRGDAVHLRYEDMTTGRIHRVRAAYVVGCDGARSLIRRFIETEMEDLGFHERWLVVDVLLKGQKPELGDQSVQHCDPARPVTYVRGTGNRRRWEVKVLPDEDSNRAVAPDFVWNVLSRWVTPEEADLERAAVYTFHSLLARDWRRGRLLVAGDAAHQTPPFMAQGMCAGIRDAANLGWKLARAVRDGDDGDALLDSYQSERLPNARDYIAAAVRMGWLINTEDPQAALGAATRDADGRLTMAPVRPPLGPGIGRGPQAGQIFGQPLIADGRRMDDAVGYAHCLVAEPALLAAADLPEGLATVSSADAPEVAAELARFGAAAVLVRPDRYVQGTAADAAGLSALLAGI